MRLLLLLALLPACVGPASDDKDPADDTDTDTDTDTDVDGCPVAVVTPDTLEWTGLVYGSSDLAEVSVVNNCAGDNALSVIPSVEGAAFAVDATPVSVAPGGVATIVVTVTADDYAGASGTLLLGTNDPAAPTISVPLTATVDADLDDDGYSTVDAGGDDCDDLDAAINPGATEVWYDAIDQDCSGTSDYDADNDGFDDLGYGGADCDDGDAAIRPDAVEAWYDGVDQDCDGAWDDDADGDGVAATAVGGADCDDADATVLPGAEDAWYDGVDADCAGDSDYDADADGFDATAYGGADCDDADGAISPLAAETWYDGIDGDCDGAPDWDADRDGFDLTSHGGDDCDDTDAAVNTGAIEVWYDGVDQDCSGTSDYDADGDGYDSETYSGADCDDLAATVNPGAAEAWYDGLDADCDGASDYDRDGDGFDSDAYGGDDCGDTSAAIRPTATETYYDGVDADCDGASDYDADGDGYDSDAWGGDDCGDAAPSVYPGAAETWYDGVDADCDGASDYDADGDGVERYPQGVDCADTDAASTAGTAETRNGVDDDCDGMVDEGFGSAGDIVITEVMPNPAAVSDTVGEWFEVYNTTVTDIDLVGWAVYSDDGQTFTVARSTVVPARGYAVLGASANPSANGGVSVGYDYSWFTFGLNDAGDSLYLYSGSTLVAEVSWGSTWPFASGAAMQLDDDHSAHADATMRANWCVATDAYGIDLGSPGSPNGECASLDDDGDGSAATDCDDDDADVHWGATESADLVDQNCNQWVDDEPATSATMPSARGAISTDYVTFGGLGDYDGDGTPELVIADSSATSGTHGLYLIDGAGFRGWSASYADLDEASFTPSSAGERFSNAAAGPPADLTGDGIDDLVYSNSLSSTGTGFVVYEGPITGTTAARVPDVNFRYSEGTFSHQPESVALGGDLDGDGLSEVVYANPGGAYGGASLAGAVTVLTQADLAAGTIDYSASTVTLIGSVASDYVGNTVEIADVDGDGYDDLVVGSLYARTYVWLSDGLATTGTQTLASTAALSITGTYSSSGHATISLPDVDGDGQLDLAVSDYYAACLYTDIGGRSGTLAVTDADATFDPAIASATPYNDYFGALDATPDLDGDGHGEMAVWSQLYDYSDTTIGFFGAGASTDGALTEAEAVYSANLGRTLPSGYTPNVRTGDVDGDGADELLLFSRYLTLGTSTYLEGGVMVIEP